MVTRTSPLSTNPYTISPSFRLASKLFPLNLQTKWKLDFVPLLKGRSGHVFNLTRNLVCRLTGF